MKSCIAKVELGDGHAGETSDHFTLVLEDKMAFTLEPFSSTPEGFLEVRKISPCCCASISFHRDNGYFCALCGKEINQIGQDRYLPAESPRSRDGFSIMDLKKLESMLDYEFDTLAASLIFGPTVALMTSLMNQAWRDRPRPLSLTGTRAHMREIAQEWNGVDLMASLSLKVSGL